MTLTITPLGSIGTPNARPTAMSGAERLFACARDLPGVFFVRMREDALHVVRVERDGTEHEVVTIARRSREHCYQLEVSPDGRLLCMTSTDADGLRARVFRDGRPLDLPLPRARVDLSSAWIGEGAYLCVSSDNETSVIDVEAGVLLHSFPSDVQLGFSERGDHLFVKSWRDATLSVYTLGASGRPASMEVRPSKYVDTFSPAGAVLWSLQTLSEDRRIHVACWEHARDLKHAVDFEPGREHDCRYVLHMGPASLTAHVECSCGDGARLQWEPSTGRISLHRYHRPHEGTPTDFQPPVSSGPSVRDRSLLLDPHSGRYGLRQDNLLCEWDPDRQAWRSAFDFPDGAVGAIALSPGGRDVAFGRADGSIRIARLEDGSVRWDLEGHDGAVECCIWSRDGATLYTVSKDRTVRGWDVVRGAERLCVKTPADLDGWNDCTCVLSEDGDVLIFAFFFGGGVTYDLARGVWSESFDYGYKAQLRVLRAGERGVQCQMQYDEDSTEPDQQGIGWFDPARSWEQGEVIDDPELSKLCARGWAFPGGDRAVVLTEIWMPDDEDEADATDDGYDPADELSKDAGAIVDLDTGKLLRLAPSGYAFMTAACATVGERWVAAGYSLESRVTLWDARTGALLPPIELPIFEHATAIAVCDARSELLVGTNGGRVLRYRLDGG